MKEIEKQKLFNTDINKTDWLGIVVDNNDPLKEYRCKIRVFGLFDTLEVEDIPWAYPCGNLQFAGGGGIGQISVPKINTILKVKFDNGNIYSPEYVSIKKVSEAVKFEVSDSYLNSHIICFDEDENLKLFYTNKKGIEISLKDVKININNEQVIEIKNTNGDYIKLENNGNLTINCNNNANINVSNTATIEGKKIKFGEKAVQSIIKGNEFMDVYKNHTHIGNLGASTGTPLDSMISTLSSKVYTE